MSYFHDNSKIWLLILLYLVGIPHSKKLYPTLSWNWVPSCHSLFDRWLRFLSLKHLVVLALCKVWRWIFTENKFQRPLCSLRIYWSKVITMYFLKNAPEVSWVDLIRMGLELFILDYWLRRGALLESTLGI